MPTRSDNKKSMNDKKILVEATNLAVSYGDKIIWNDASFSIGKGKFVAVLGPNGAGKTTLFKLLLGLIKPDKGTVKVLGENPKRGNPKIGYVPQRRLIDSEMNIEAAELVRLGLYGNSWGLMSGSEVADVDAATMEVLKSVDAINLAHRPLGALSGGELQRIFLAQALISNPDLLLLDEPLANLDVRRQYQLVQLISKIVKTNKVSVLLIAHDLNPLLSVLDGVIYVANNKLAGGSPKSIISTKVLSELYDANVEVIRDSKGRIAIMGVEEAAHHD
jgi:zinc/manganese transport system ATP-binding protein